MKNGVFDEYFACFEGIGQTKLEVEVTWCLCPLTIIIFLPYVHHTIDRLHFKFHVDSLNSLEVMTILLIVINPSDGEPL